MQFLTKDECAAWTSAQGFPFVGKPDYRVLEDAGFHHTRFATPADAGRRIALARTLWHATSDRAQRLLWVTAWGIWPSSEHMPLYASLRKGFGDNRTLIEAPGHLFQLGEDENGLSFMTLALLFFWDAYLLGAGGDVTAFVSHDEYCVVVNRVAGEGVLFEQQLAPFMGPAA